MGVKLSNSLPGFGIVNLEWAGKEILASLKEHRIWCLDLGAMRLGGRGFVAECGAGAFKAGAGGRLSISKEEYAIIGKE